MDTRTDSQDKNVIGAVIFVCYVFSALYLTGFIIGTLLHSYQSLRSPRSKSRLKNLSLERQVQMFASLSVVSFSVLSYYMINVLFQSYKAWATAQNIESRDQPEKDGSSLDRHVYWPCICLWEWLEDSHLFEDFGNAIVENDSRYWWTQQALLVSITWSVFMSVEGRKREVPHLWAYTVIAQILPISFTQNLFFLAVLLTPLPNPDSIIYPPSLWVQVIPLSAYFLGLFYARHAAGTKALIPVILIIRFLLFSPFLIPLGPSSSRASVPITIRNAHISRKLSYRFIATCSAVLWLWQTIRAISEIARLKNTHRLPGSSIIELLEAVNDDPAVSALGWDFLISLFSNAVWISMIQKPPG